MHATDARRETDRRVPSRSSTRGPARTIALMLAARLTIVKAATRSPADESKQSLGNRVDQRAFHAGEPGRPPSA